MGPSDRKVIGRIIFVVKELALSLPSGESANINPFGPVLKEVSIIRRQRKKKKRCMPAIQEGRPFSLLTGGGIG